MADNEIKEMILDLKKGQEERDKLLVDLKKGQEIDPNNLKSILDNEMYMKAKNKALSILSKASQSEKQIR